MRSLERQLKNLGSALQKSAVLDATWKKAERTRLVAQVWNTNIKEQAPEASQTGFWGSHKLFYARLRFAAKTSLVVAVAVPLVLSGWMSAVNAAMDSLPGDFLYSLKIAGERAQVALLSGADKKAKLQTEFAGRRLEEATKLAAQAPGTSRAKEAISGFKKELETVNRHLDSLRAAAPEKAIEVARFVDRKTEEYRLALAETSPSMPESARDAVRVAAAMVEEMSLKAVEVIVEEQAAGRISLADEVIADKVSDKIQGVEGKLNDLVASLSSIIETNDRATSTALSGKAILREAKSLLAERNFVAALSKMKEAGFLTQEAERMAIQVSKASVAADGSFDVDASAETSSASSTDGALQSGNTSSSVIGAMSGAAAESRPAPDFRAPIILEEWPEKSPLKSPLP